jgi:hypothetical protein
VAEHSPYGSNTFTRAPTIFTLVPAGQDICGLPSTSTKGWACPVMGSIFAENGMNLCCCANLTLLEDMNKNKPTNAMTTMNKTIDIIILGAPIIILCFA